MGRYNVSFYSAAAVAADAPIAAIVPAASVACKIRRITLGVVAGTGAPTSQQLVVGLNRGTARGTATTTLTMNKMDPRHPASAITGVDTAWSVNPTFGASSTDFAKVPINSQSGADLPWEGIEELWTDIGTANPIVLVNRDNVIPASHKYTITIETEE
jgi:hypothetical protein